MKDFAAAFAALLRAAGLNPDALLRELARQNRRGLVTRTTLYDWKNGVHLPEDDRAFVAVVSICLRYAHARGVRLALPEVSDWTGQLAEAKQSRDSASVPHRSRNAYRAPRAARRAGDWDPVMLGIHKAIGGNPLPEYVRRDHDDLLGAVMDPDVETNRLVLLRGGSSTGKSRSAYHAISAGKLASWRLEYPLTPAGLARRIDDGLPPRTVLWLGELRDYADAEAGPEALERLADLLADHRYVIAITTLWPVFWNAYTRDHHGGPGARHPYPAARALLAGLPLLTTVEEVDPRKGGVIDVPAEFTCDELARAWRSSDPALAVSMVAAAREHHPARVTQYLAGVPDLLGHYQNPSADPYGHAVITAALDAARLGVIRRFSPAFLQEAAIGYLADEHRVLPAAKWRTAAFSYATRELRGTIRALTPVPPKTGTGVAAYQLADFLDQYARAHLAGTVPPAAFWAAAAIRIPATGQTWFASSAEDCGLLRHAAQLAKNATHADAYSAAKLVGLLGRLHPGDERPAQWAAANADLSTPWTFKSLLRALRDAGRNVQVTTLLNRCPEMHADLRDPYGVAELLEELRDAGRNEQVTTLLSRDPAAHVDLGSTLGVASLLEELRAAGADAQVTALLDRDPAQHADLSHHFDIGGLLRELHDAGADTQMTALARRAAAQVDTSNPGAVALLLRELREGGAAAHVTALLNRDPAAHARLGLPGGVALLLGELRQAKAHGQVATLLGRLDREASENTEIIQPDHLDELLKELQAAGAGTQAVALANQAVARVTLADLDAVMWLMDELQAAGAKEQVAALLNRDPAAHADLSSPYAAGALLAALRAAGADAQVTALLSRNPAACGVLVYPFDIARLLAELHNAGDEAQVTALVERILAAPTDLRTEDSIDTLLEVLRDVGADTEAETLITRLPAADQFGLLCSDGEYGETYKFGREPDGRPTATWGWDDLI